ncbi:MAG: hypothetical protein RQ745_05355 [Longimicrobiales bacterium]|nr:hypothetical protein [Longimicrobiales bacterium]
MTDTPTPARDLEHDLDLGARRARAAFVWRRALFASFVVHIVVALLLFLGRPPIPPSPFAAAGPRAADDQAAAGGMQVVTVQAPPEREIVRPPPPIVTPSLETIEPVEFDDVPQLEVQTAQVAGLLPIPELGPGTATGEGEGDGGSTEEGRFRITPPTPRGMIIPPTNRELRGSEVEVWVFVDPRGRVVADSTRLDPPTSDRDFNRRLIREAAEWVFTPARRGEEEVAAWFPYRISM